MRTISITLLLLIPMFLFSQTKSEVEDEIIRQGIKCPKIVLAQCYYETAHLSSNIFKYNHNLFGMKEAHQRKTTAIGTKRNHAYYRTWQDSIRDYKIWQDKYYKGGDYYTFLSGSGYATSEKYIKTLKNIKV